MSIEAVQIYHAETPVAQPRARVPAAGTSARSQDWSGGPMTPRDAVVVSDQARRLAALGAGTDAPHLQLDFKQLRELAFTSQSNPSAGSSE
jgi:hypothetical protein